MEGGGGGGGGIVLFSRIIGEVCGGIKDVETG